MCGIVGSISLREPVDVELLTRQRDVMTHRGPDSEGLWVSPDRVVAFGHRRLAIIDLSPGGHQPMIHHSSGCVITFNGEIYNYVALRVELRNLGQSFKTASDTEVILAAYQEWGDAFLTRLEGMFAFAIYDPHRKRVLLARDRAGEKPLFFHTMDGRTSFASEIKALLIDSRYSRRVRPRALNEYLAYGYTTGDETIFAGIHRLKPGSKVVVNLLTGKMIESSYWELPTTRAHAADDSDDTLVERLHELLRGAVSRQLMADVPVGILLSGGVDSSLIAAIAAEVSRAPISTYTVRFPGKVAFDEGPFARLVSAHLGSVHTEIDARPPSLDLLRRLTAQFDEPFADSSMIPMFMVSEEIRHHASVAIGGDGGDELFGGYKRYPRLIRGEQLRKVIPETMRRAVASIGQQLIFDGRAGLGTLQGLAGTLGTSIANAGRIFREDERAALAPSIARLTPTDLCAPERRRSEMFSDRCSSVQRATAVDFSSYMVDDVLVKVDRASMLSSLEVRAPFLDKGIIDFAFTSVADHLRATSRERKVLLKKLGAKVLPAQLDLSRKQGFSIPLADWLRQTWRGTVSEVVADRDQSIISNGEIRRLQKLLDQGKPVQDRLFSLVVLRMWERTYQVTDVSDG